MIGTDKHIMVGGSSSASCKTKNMDYNEIDRNNLFEVLKSNQKLLDNDKHKLLLKQNILGLIKSTPYMDTNNNNNRDNHYLYNDPSINVKAHEQLKESLPELTKFITSTEFNISDIVSKFNVNDINDYNIVHSIKVNPIKLIGKLINEYFNINGGKNIQTNKSINVDKQTQTQEKESKSININNPIYLNNNGPKDFSVTADLKSSAQRNGIIFCSNMNEINCTNKLFILYDISNNIIYVFDNMVFNY